MTRVQRWQQATEWPLTGAAALFLAVYAWPIIDPHLPAPIDRACRLVQWVTWIAFVIDYVVRLVLADHRTRYLLHHLLDLAVVALPLLRPLRLLRLVVVLDVVNRRAESSLRGKVAVYVGGGSALLAFCGALAVLDAERASPRANIVTFGDAIWWAITTMTTVGYGDYVPVTDTGKLAAVALMVGGVALLGVVTATLASWLVEHVAVADRKRTVELSDEVVAMRGKLDRIAALLEDREAAAAGTRAPSAAATAPVTGPTHDRPER